MPYFWDGLAVQIAAQNVWDNPGVKAEVAKTKQRKMLLYVAAAVIAIGVILFLRKR